MKHLNQKPDWRAASRSSDRLFQRLGARKLKASSPNTVHLSVSQFLSGKNFFWSIGQQYGSGVKVLDLHNHWLRHVNCICVSSRSAACSVFMNGKKGEVMIQYWSLCGAIKECLQFQWQRLTLISKFSPWLRRVSDSLFEFTFVRGARSKFGTRPDPQILQVSFIQARLTTSFELQQIAAPQHRLWPVCVSAVSVICTHSYLILIRWPMPSQFCGCTEWKWTDISAKRATRQGFLAGLEL